MAEFFVTKRSKEKVPYEVKKVKKVIDWACEDLNINSLKLESLLDDFLFDGISTLKIHENIIFHALTLAKSQEPEWVVVCGRLKTMLLWKESKFKENDFFNFFNYSIENNIYNKEMFSMYSQEDIKYFSSLIVPERDLDHSYGSVLTACNRYLQKNETIQYMHMGNAMAIASVEEPENRISFVKKLYEVLSLRKISLATPWLSNLRSAGNISSCFIIGVEDNIESLSDNWKRAALISKNGGGLGIDLSRIRAENSEINGREGASGGISGWAKIFNDIAVVVDQGGKRAGAFTVHLPIWHRDIETFLEIQAETGDLRKKAYDIFPQVGINDLFMEIQKDKEGVWHTFCPHEVKKNLGIELYSVFGDEFRDAYLKCVEAYENGILKNVGKYIAREQLVKMAMRTMYETGVPYVSFLDTINRLNPNKHDGIIPCVNLCTESFSNVVPDQLSHTCNLASPVVGRIHSIEEAIEIAAITVHILDNGITLTRCPDKINEDHNNRYRTVGTGIQGLHDYLVLNNTTYNNKEAISELVEAIAYGCVKKSVELAKRRGKYPAFKGSRWDTGEQINQYIEHTNGNFDWESLQKEIDVHGIRNSQLMSPAPNTSTSVFMDAAAGVMPVYSGFFREDNSVGKFPVASMYLSENPLGYAKTFNLFKQTDLAEVVGVMQKHIDTGISAEFLLDQNLPHASSALHLYQLINKAHESGLKAIYYIRTIKKGSNIEDLLGITDSGCVGCAG